MYVQTYTHRPVLIQFLKILVHIPKCMVFITKQLVNFILDHTKCIKTLPQNTSLYETHVHIHTQTGMHAHAHANTYTYIQNTCMHSRPNIITLLKQHSFIFKFLSFQHTTFILNQFSQVLILTMRRSHTKTCSGQQHLCVYYLQMYIIFSNSLYVSQVDRIFTF